MKSQSRLLTAAFLSLLLAACGDKPAPDAAASAPAAAAPATGVAAADNSLGKDVYRKSCTACHGAGIAGAPKTGDKAMWGPRIAQGKETLYKHAIEGFTGSTGIMLARGGNSRLSDDEVKAAVDFMADQAM